MSRDEYVDMHGRNSTTCCTCTEANSALESSRGYVDVTRPRYNYIISTCYSYITNMC